MNIPISIMCVVLVALPIASCSHAPSTEDTRAHHQHDGPIHNLHQLAPGLYSGGEPPEAEHYAQLASMGIRTVVSVDAVAPNPELAEPYNIRIVHLPIGYDGISAERSVELAAAIETLEHPIYVHCHHGKHRGPAALCVGAIGAGLITNTQAREYMETTGTSPKYTGLWEAASDARTLDDDTISAVGDLPSRAPVPGFIKAMGRIDRLHDRIRAMSEHDWQTPDDHPDLTPSAVSGQIHDLLRSLMDSEYVTEDGEVMRHELRLSIDAAAQLEQRIDAGDWSSADESLAALGQTCRSCHELFRD